jgi:hypothetical protein
MFEMNECRRARIAKIAFGNRSDSRFHVEVALDQTVSPWQGLSLFWSRVFPAARDRAVSRPVDP